MNTITEFPFKVNEIEHFYIPLQDGTQLAARLWLPESANKNQPVPVILEYLPYRKRDGTAVRDALTHPYLAGYGYACLRVDLRGCGESTGQFIDEYVKQEQDDALEVIDWITNQEWCSGNVGMMGISWGGFNALQVAMRAPEALKAIITICSTHNRFSDDIHYKGGALLLENSGWAATMLSYLAAVPDPQLVGDQWRPMWLDRLKNMPLLIKNWLSHQEFDEYWQQGSVCTDYSSIKAAVYTIGGWGDSYSNSVFQLMENLQSPKKALVGPWAHKYPHFAVPNPAIGFLQEALRWWDYWLKGIDNGIMAEPKMTTYLQDAAPPQASYSERKGQWISEDDWSSNRTLVSFHLTTDRKLSPKAITDTTTQTINSPLTTGKHSGEFCIIWLGPEFPTDQRQDDSQSICFETEPLDEDFALSGAGKISLYLSNTHQKGQIIARLNDIAPDGSATRMTYCVVNLNNPQQIIKKHILNIQLDDVAYKIPKGHKIRLSLSNAYFPLVWPSTTHQPIEFIPALSTLKLPLHLLNNIITPTFKQPESATPCHVEYLRDSKSTRTVNEDIMSGKVTTEIFDDFGRYIFKDFDFTVEQICQESYSILPNDPYSAQSTQKWFYSATRGSWKVSIDSEIVIHADKEWFYIKATQKAYENDACIHKQAWDEKVKRVYC